MPVELARPKRAATQRATRNAQKKAKSDNSKNALERLLSHMSWDNSNENKKAYEKVSKEGLKSLREKAEIWFADDYRFYDAAIDQYKLYLAASTMDPSHLEKCMY